MLENIKKLINGKKPILWVGTLALARCLTACDCSSSNSKEISEIEPKTEIESIEASGQETQTPSATESVPEAQVIQESEESSLPVVDEDSAESVDIDGSGQPEAVESTISFTESELPVFSEDAEVNHAYYEAIVTLETTGYLPDGSYCYFEGVYEEQKKSAYGNDVAVVDYDLDGKNELLIRIGGTCNADFTSYLYEYDEQTKTFTKVFAYYAGMSFHSKGFISGGVSHSQYIFYEYGFWPYEIFALNQVTGKCELYASVDQLTVKEEDAQKWYGDEFPYEDDLDGDKVIFFVTQDSMTKNMDNAEYLNWMEELLGEEIPYQWVPIGE